MSRFGDIAKAYDGAYSAVREYEERILTARGALLNEITTALGIGDAFALLQMESKSLPGREVPRGYINEDGALVFVFRITIRNVFMNFQWSMIGTPSGAFRVSVERDKTFDFVAGDGSSAPIADYVEQSLRELVASQGMVAATGHKLSW